MMLRHISIRGDKIDEGRLGGSDILLGLMRCGEEGDDRLRIS